MTSAASKPSTRQEEQRTALSFFLADNWPAGGWKQVLQGTWQDSNDDNIGIAAAGVAFYGFLAIVPLLGAIVLSYGLIADPATVVMDMRHLTSVMPGDAARLIGEQLMNVVKTSGTRKGFGLLLALALALFGARNGAGSVVIGLNIAYEEKETRSFLRLTLLALVITVAAVIAAIVALVAIAALGFLEKLIPGTPGVVLVLGKIVTYVVVALGGAAGAATLYRYAPDHSDARWVWLSPGSVLAAILWLLLTLGFGIYVADFGDYNATYGSLGAVAVTLTWLYLSSYVLLMGAELNSQLNHHKARPKAGTPTLSDQEDAAGSGSRAAKAAPATVAATTDLPREPDITSDLALWRAGRRARRAIGSDQVGLAPSLMATAGLALLRRRDRAPAGFVLLAASGLIALSGAAPANETRKRLWAPKARKSR